MAVTEVRHYGATSSSKVPLEEVVVDKTQLVGLDLFEKINKDLVRAVEHKKKVVQYSCIPGFISLGVAAGGLIYSWANNDINGFHTFIGGMFSAPVVIVGIFFADAFYGRNALLYTEGYQSVQDFHESYAAFEKNPQEYCIKNLLEKFANISSAKWFQDSLDKGLISKEEGQFLQQQGKFFLMSQLVQMIEQYQPESTLVSNWKIELEALSNPHAQYPATDLWNLLGTAAPNRAACVSYMPKWMASMSLSMKVMEIFCRVVPQVI